MKNSCTRLGVLTLAAIISFAGVCAEAGKCVVTYTFDDGLADQYTIAYPMFRKAGLPATFFIIGSKVGDENGIRNKAERNTPIMTWDQIRDMSTNGMEIASHGWAHAKYAKMGRDEILDDIRRNQVALKEHVGVDCVSFASPFNTKKGADGSDIEALAKEAGLRAMRMKQKGAGSKMTAEQMNELVESAKKKGEWLVFMVHGMARGYDAWENPQELEKHLAWVKEQKDVRVLSFADAAKAFFPCVKYKGVRYRGIFVNDEDWSLRPWAVKHFGKKEQIGVRAYEKIFSLMEKDGLNLIWPAMHEGGYEFSSRPENLELARKHGITVGTSHCEPMLRNNCYLSKEDKKKWSWTANRDFLVDYWKEGVRRGTGFSNRVERVDRVEDILWTIGMRGIHDGKMQDGKTTEEKIKILEEVFAAQCAMLPEGAPKLFVPYKEVLPIFNAGLKVPKGATIMWTNDNFGYVRRVGGPQCEGYGGGIYWHASYHGSPHGYIHLCTTPPAFMWYELVAKCWENGVRDVWMVNAGDVFQAEILLDAYGRFALSPEQWGADAQPKVLAAWVREKLELEVGVGEWNRSSSNSNSSLQLGDRIVAHLAEYYNLGFNRRPEHMCVQWTTNLPATVKSSLLTRYHALLEDDLSIERELQKLTHSQLTTHNSKIADDYFRLVGFQARFLAYAGIIHLEGRDREYARSVIDPLYERWDKLDNGKWSGFWCDTIDERGGKRQPTAHNRWSSQMQWPWNEPAPGTKDKGKLREDYPATAYRADIQEPEWLESVANTPANGGAWTRVEGLGTSGRALALLPVKPGVGKGAAVEYALTGFTRLTGLENHVNPVNPVEEKTLILQFLPDFALWPGLKLGVEVSFDDGAAKYVAVPKSDANIGEHDPVRNRAVQDNFIRVEVPVPVGAKTVKIVATDPGVVIDRVGIRATVSLALPESAVEFRECPKCDKGIRIAPGAKKAFVNQVL